MNQRIAWGSLLLAVALPVMAQDEAAVDQAIAAEEAAAVAEEAAVEETAAEAEAPAEEAPAADAALVDAAAAPAEDSAETTAEAPEEVAEEAAEEVADAGEPEDSSDLDSDEGLGLDLYVGVEFDQTTVDLQNEGLGNAFGSNRFDSDFYKLRLGARIADGIGVELHAGFPAHDAGEGEVETKQFYAFYFVPTGVLFNTLEVSARLGYAMTSLENELTDDDFDGMSFGLAAELPIRLFGEGLPNLRFGVGATVYQEDNEARVYGFHGGLRFDFSI